MRVNSVPIFTILTLVLTLKLTLITSLPHNVKLPPNSPAQHPDTGLYPGFLIPIPVADRAQFAANMAQLVKSAIFKTTPGVSQIVQENVRNAGMIGPRPNPYAVPQHVDKSKLPKRASINEYLTEKRFDTVAIQVESNGIDFVVAMNVKERALVPVETVKKDKGRLPPHGIAYDSFGYQPTHKAVIQRVLSQFPQLKDSIVTVVGPKVPPQTDRENAAPHAEMQLLSYNKRGRFPSQGVVLGVSKEPCGKCIVVLEEHSANFAAAGGESLAFDNVKSWDQLGANIPVDVKDQFLVSESSLRQRPT